MESADIVLMKKTLKDVIVAMELSNATMRNINKIYFGHLYIIV